MGKIDTFKSRTDTAITNKTDINSIAPVAVGNKINELADIVQSFVLTVWSSTANNNNGYSVESLVIYQNKIYVSLVDQNKVIPGTDITKWTMVLNGSE